LRGPREPHDTKAKMVRFEIRGAGAADEDALLGLARHLNSVNLPHDRAHVRRLLEHSEKSFRGEVPERRRKFVFLICLRESGEALGTSTIVAQLGRRDAPYIYLDVSDEEKFSSALDRHFHHTVLRIGFSYDGPTELGGLVVAPEHRQVPERIGLLISYVRFLYIAGHPALFRQQLLAELMPPLEPDGTSHLWEALGRRFTGMSYAEADLLSSENKSFIRDLFPSGSIYASLLSQEAQSVIGRVGAQTRGVEKMLRRVGFRYARRIDPFDGGPHFIAPVEEVSLIGATRRTSVTVGAPGSSGRALVARTLTEAPFFRAVAVPALVADDTTTISPEAAAVLGVQGGEEILVLPVVS
jgi:arginine N-succinyltransferase